MQSTLRLTAESATTSSTQHPPALNPAHQGISINLDELFGRMRMGSGGTDQSSSAIGGGEENKPPPGFSLPLLQMPPPGFAASIGALMQQSPGLPPGFDPTRPPPPLLPGGKPILGMHSLSSPLGVGKEEGPSPLATGTSSSRQGREDSTKKRRDGPFQLCQAWQRPFKVCAVDNALI